MPLMFRVDPIVLRDETLNILLAGRDTVRRTSCSHSYASIEHVPRRQIQSLMLLICLLSTRMFSAVSETKFCPKSAVLDDLHMMT